MFCTYFLYLKFIIGKMKKAKSKDIIKLKVAWICHFSNQEVQSISHPEYFVDEFAPWITNLARIFENDSGIELHILSPQTQLSFF
jgi:hypothetical protein